MNGQEVAKELIKLRLSNTDDIDLFVNEIMSAHRTDQQSVMKLLLRAIVAYGDQHRANRFDLRNQKSCELADRILGFLEEEDVVSRTPTKVWLPYI
jgi:hypothetical protein